MIEVVTSPADLAEWDQNAVPFYLEQITSVREPQGSDVEFEPSFSFKVPLNEIDLASVDERPVMPTLRHTYNFVNRDVFPALRPLFP